MKKVISFLNKLYGILMAVSFFGGIIPLIPFIVAIIIGGNTGEQIALFLYKQYYPWVIALASVSVLIGLVGIYLGKQHSLSVKNTNNKEQEEK